MRRQPNSRIGGIGILAQPGRHRRGLRRRAPGGRCGSDAAATLAQQPGLRELFDDYVDLARTAVHVNLGHKAMTLLHSALAGR